MDTTKIPIHLFKIFFVSCSTVRVFSVVVAQVELTSSRVNMAGASHSGDGEEDWTELLSRSDDF